jgi:hypothetical protein
MMARMKLPLILASWTLFISAGQSAPSGDLDCRIDREQQRIEIYRSGVKQPNLGKQPLLVYVYGTNLFKPYIKELRTLNGENVLLDSPPDHLHHHGLMYAIRVNGINFWEETPPSGIQKPVGTVFGEIAGTGPKCGFSHLVYWLAPGDRNHPDPKSVALLIEHRTIIVAVDADRQEVAVEWKSDFVTGTATKKYVLSGADYNGLGLRPIRSFDRVAKRLNPHGLAYSVEAKWDVVGGLWGALIGTAGNGEATLTIFDYPPNKGESLFFSMLNPFAYLAATQALDKKPQEYPAGAKFSVRYLVTLHQGARTAEFLNQRYHMW